MAFKEYGYNEFYLKEKKYTARNEKAVNTIELIRISCCYIFLLTFFKLEESEIIVLVVIYISDIFQPKSVVKLLRNKKNDILFKVEFIASIGMVCCFLFLDFADVDQKLFAYSFYHVIRTYMLRKILRLKYAATITKGDLNFLSDGKWVFSSALVFLALTRLDKILIQPYISISDLGGFLFISNVFNMSFQVVVKSIKPIIDRQIAITNAAFPKIYLIYSAMVLLVAILFASLSEDMLSFVFNDKWQSYYWIINYAVLIGLFNNLKIWGLFYSKGLFRYRFWVDSSQFIFFALGLSILLLLGDFTLMSLLNIQLGAGLLSFLIWIYFSCHVYDYSLNNDI